VDISVQAEDFAGNDLSTSGGLVTLSSSAGTLGQVTDNGDGTYSATLTAPTSPGTATISGTIDGNPITSTSMVTFG
jgi:hypothetical protein